MMPVARNGLFGLIVVFLLTVAQAATFPVSIKLLNPSGVEMDPAVWFDYGYVEYYTVRVMASDGATSLADLNPLPTCAAALTLWTGATCKASAATTRALDTNAALNYYDFTIELGATAVGAARTITVNAGALSDSSSNTNEEATAAYKVGFQVTAFDLVKTADKTASIHQKWVAGSAAAGTYAVYIEVDSTFSVTASVDLTKLTTASFTVSGSVSQTHGANTALVPLAGLTRGTYEFTLPGGVLCTSAGACNAPWSSSPSTLHLYVGFALSSVQFMQGSTVVSNKWIAKSNGGTKLVFTTTDSGVQLTTSGGGYDLAWVWLADSNDSGFTLVESSGTAAALSNGAKTLTVALDLSGSNSNTGEYTVSIQPGALCDSDGTCNALYTPGTALKLKIGHDVSTVALVDSSDWSTDLNGVWISAASASVGLLVTFADNTISWLAGSASANNPTNLAANLGFGGVSAGASEYIAQLPLDLQNMATGKYSLTLKEGTLCVYGACNVEYSTPVLLQLGFQLSDFDLVLTTSTSTSTSVAGQWLSAATVGKYAFKVTAPSGTTLSTVATTGYTLSSLQYVPSIVSGSVTATGTVTRPSNNIIVVPLSLTGVTPADYTVTAMGGTFCDTTGGCNVEMTSSVSLKLGFDVTFDLVDADTWATTAHNKWIDKNGNYGLLITASPTTVALDDTATVMTAITATPSSGSAVALTATSVAAGTSSYIQKIQLDFTGLALNTYTISIASGAVCTSAGVCNTAVSATKTLKLGFGVNLDFVKRADYTASFAGKWVSAASTAANALYGLTITPLDGSITSLSTTSLTISSFVFTPGVTATTIGTVAVVNGVVRVPWNINAGGTTALGKYAFTLSEGAVCTTTAPIVCNYNPNTAVPVWFGFELSGFDIVRRNSWTTSLSNTWLPKTDTLVAMIFTCPASTAITLNANYGGTLDFSAFTGLTTLSIYDIPSAADMTVAATPSPQTLRVPIDMSTTGYGSYTISSVPGGVVCNSDGSKCNAPYTVSKVLKVGFAISAFSIVDTSDWSTSVSTIWQSKASPTFGLKITAEDTALVLASASPKTGMGTGVTFAFGTVSTESGADNVLHVPVTAASTLPLGTTAITLVAGVACTAAGVCNGAYGTTANMLIGFDVMSGGFKLVKTSDWTTDMSNSWTAKSLANTYGFTVATQTAGVTFTALTSNVVLSKLSTTPSVTLSIGTSGISATSSGSGTVTATQRINLKYDTQPYGEYTITLGQGTVCATVSGGGGTACNAAFATPVILKIGFALSSIGFVATSDYTTNAATDYVSRTTAGTYGLTLTAVDSALTLDPDYFTISALKVTKGGSTVSALTAVTANVALASGSKYVLHVPLDLTSTAYGIYTVAVQQAVICDLTGGCNAENLATTVAMKIGFDVDSIDIRTVNAASSADSIDNVWVSRTLSNAYALYIWSADTTGVSFASGATATAVTGNGVTGLAFGAVSAGSSNAVAKAVLNLGGVAFASYTLNVKGGMVCTSTGACNVAYTSMTLTLKVGFDISSFQLLPATGAAAWQTASSVHNVWVSQTTAGAYGLEISTASSGITFGTSVSRVDFSLITSDITLALSGSMATANAAQTVRIPLDFTAETMGTYTLQLLESAICNSAGTACNAAYSSTRTLKIGFDVTADITTTQNDADSKSALWLSREVPFAYDLVVYSQETLDTGVVPSLANLVSGSPSTSAMSGTVAISGGNAAAPLRFTSLAPRKYDLSIKSGVICTAAGVCNAEALRAVTLKVGIDVAVTFYKRSSNTYTDVTSVWSNPATDVLYAQVDMSTTGVTFATSYTSSTLPSLSSAFSDTSSIPEASTADRIIVSSTRLRYKLQQPANAAAGQYFFFIADGGLCTSTVTADQSCTVGSTTDPIARLRIGFPLTLKWKTSDADELDVTSEWRRATDVLLFSVGADALAAAGPTYANLFASTAPIATSSASDFDTTNEYKYTVDTTGLLPAQYTFSVQQGAVNNGEADTESADYAGNYPTSVLLLIGFNTAITVRGRYDTDVTSEWIHPGSTYSVRVTVTSPSTSLDPAYANGGSSMPSYAAAVESTPSTAEAGAVPRYFSYSGGQPIFVYRMATSPMHEAGYKVLAVKQGVYSNGLSGAAEVRNTYSDDVNMLIGWVPTITIKPADAAADGSKEYAGIYDADAQTLVTPAVPSQSHSLDIIVSYDDMAAYSDTSAFTASSVFEWASGLDEPVTIAQSGGDMTFSISDRTAVPGIYTISLRQGIFEDGSNDPIMNAPLKFSLILGWGLTIRNGDGSAGVGMRSGGASAFTNLQAVRLRVEGTSSDVVRFVDLVEDVKNPASDSVLMLINGRVATPVARVPDTATRPAYIEYSLDVSSLPDSTYTANVLADSELTDTAGIQTWQAQRLSITIDRSPPVPLNQTYTDTIVYIGSAVTFALPPTLFSDAVSNTAALMTVVRVVAAGDDHGLVLGKIDQWQPQTLANSKLSATSVRAPAERAVFYVTGQDEAGNTAVASLVVPVVGRPAAVFTVTDPRGASSTSAATTIYTGATSSLVCSSISCSLALTVTASFTESITGLSATSLSILRSGTAVSPSGMVFTANSDNRLFTWKFSLLAVTHGQAYTVALPVSAGVSTAKGMGTEASAVIPVVIDRVAPVGGAAVTVTAIEASVGVPFLYNISCANPTTATCSDDDFITDAVSTGRRVTLTSSSVPGQLNGLSFKAGAVGRATISGTPTAVPTGGLVEFVITGADEAGNTVTRALRIRISAKDPNALLSFKKEAITVAEAASSPTTLDSGASFFYEDDADTITLLDTVLVTLSNTDADRSVNSQTLKEELTFTAPAGTTASTPARDPTSALWSMKLTSAGAGLAPADVTAFLQSLKYSNGILDGTPGPRTVTLMLFKGPVVVAFASVVITFRITNDAPVVTGAAAVTYTEPSAAAKPGTPDVAVFSAVTLADADDVNLMSATITMATGAVSGTNGGCDPARDYLYLPPSYRGGGLSPLVRGVWAERTCILTLRSLTGVDPVPIADMQAALRAVAFGSKTPSDPTGRWPPTGQTDTVKKNVRSLRLVVLDAGSRGQVLDSRSSAAVTALLTIVPADDPPTANLAAAFGLGGILRSTDPYANVRTVTGVTTAYKQKTFVAFRPDTGTKTSEFSFDLTATTTAGVFAKGAIVDPDDTEPLTSGVSIEVIDSNGAGQPLSSVSTVVGSWMTAASFTYSATAASTLSITVDSTVPDDKLTEYPFRLNYGPDLHLDFFVDVRALACLLSDATNYPIAQGSTLTEAAFYPANYLCEFTPFSVTSTAATESTLSRGGFDTKKTDMLAKVAALSGSGSSITRTAQIAALTEERAAARGTFQMAFPANSLSSAGSINLQAQQPDTTKLPPLPPVVDKGVTLDTSLLLQLGPAGTTFSQPVRVCMFAGDTASGFSRVLKIASQVDPQDAKKGYAPWEPVPLGSFDPLTGEVCGSITHFSLLATGTVPVQKSPTVSKKHMMGGSCPLMCSNNGVCRQDGKCLCFAGFHGYDCSQRMCPTGPSWGSQEKNAVHAQEECSGRGACDRASGQCQCYPGYEGSACERIECPNACSGHGKCRTMGEFEQVKASGYSSWENRRIQRCFCDPEYTGNDCSLRVCPFGDDPDTVCNMGQPQVQSLTLDFGVLPTSSTVDPPNDELSVIYTARTGGVYWTPAVRNVFLHDNDSEINLRNAFRSLPAWAIVDLQVSAATAASGTAVTWSITFSGRTTTGDQPLLSCPTNGAGQLGCTSPGCRPKYGQLRATNGFPLAGVTESPAYTLLQQPEPLDAGDETAAETYGVTVYVNVKHSVVGGASYFTYWATSEIYGKTESASGAVKAATAPEQPLPPQELRTAVPILYGLAVDFAADDSTLAPAPSGSATSATQVYVFSWRLASCSTSVVTDAAADYESRECSNRGLCNRQSGVCECFNGYAGHSCGAAQVQE